MFSRLLSVHVFLAYFAAMVASSFFSYGATYPLFSWRLFTHLDDYPKFFDVRVTTPSRSCLLAHCFDKPRDRAVAWSLIQNLGTPGDDPCDGHGDASPAQLALLKQQVLRIFSDESVQRAEIVSIDHSFIDYMTKKSPDDQLHQKTCYSF